MNGLTLDEIELGASASFSKTITEADVVLFAGLTGDFNPIHIDDTYAATTRFKKRLVHGMLVAGLVSTVLGTRLPGPGAIYVDQTLRFLAPVFIGDTLTARVEVVERITERNRVRLGTRCTNQQGVVVLEGEATLSPRKTPKS